jgi:hypothetical protein
MMISCVKDISARKYIDNFKLKIFFFHIYQYIFIYKNLNNK